MILKDFESNTFRQLFNTELLPKLFAAESLRKKLSAKNLFFNIVVIVFKVMFFISFVMFLFCLSNNLTLTLLTFAMIFVFGLSICICSGYMLSKLSDYKKLLKREVYNLIFDGFSDIKYKYMDVEEQSKLFDLLQELNIFGSFSKIVCDDCFVYKSNDVCCKIYDIGVYDIACGYKSMMTRKIFEGMLIVAPSFKNFSGVTRVMPDTKWKSLGEVCTSLEHVSFEDVVFEKLFDVYSSNQIEARYLLTTGFMERLVQAASKEKTQIIGSFEKGYAYIGVEKEGDLFELDISKSLIEVETYRNLFAELMNTFDLIKTLNLKIK